ncbi:hypothetical protein [Sphingomonas desiccabilis]|uniref:Lipoprotein n=1 Tax=Sphingomonas desiccabilis TaxID=429134 RepID=A0A4Q2J0D5_9SPHN|nr:hypothetical protein [Sphingomonas desiccabilis]MBB3910622.1 hypothetical protein [Sphingomonas desiccabilis]RXZ35248.1 hypothetical protein EO081_06370 [Sphingomonas desiccabilis]
MRAVFWRCGGIGLLSLMLGACGDEGPSDPPRGLRIACATGGAQLAQTCFVEQSEAPQGLVLTVRRADGGFRRLLVAEDGSGVTAADGADPAVVHLRSPNEIEVEIGDDRFRLPARVDGGKAA